MLSYDAILVVGFGGPEKHEDVMPFLENVTRGRGIPRERLLGVAGHYYHFDGRSPINEQVRALIEALRGVVDLPIYWGNRNWHPMLADTVRQMKADGIRRAVAIATSAFSSYSGCRQYRENIADTRRSLGIAANDPSSVWSIMTHTERYRSSAVMPFGCRNPIPFLATPSQGRHQ